MRIGTKVQVRREYPHFRFCLEPGIITNIEIIGTHARLETWVEVLFPIEDGRVYYRPEELEPVK